MVAKVSSRGHGNTGLLQQMMRERCAVGSPLRNVRIDVEGPLRIRR